MKVVNKNSVKIIEDVCGVIRELYHSKNLSVSIATMTGKSVPHMHKKMEEIYYVVKGKGKMVIDGELAEIKEGDLISIPKNKFHHVETEPNESIEVIVVTHPKFDTSDVIKKTS